MKISFSLATWTRLRPTVVLISLPSMVIVICADAFLALPLVFFFALFMVDSQPWLTAEAIIFTNGVFQAEALAEPFGILIDNACEIFGKFFLRHQQGVGRGLAQAASAGQFHDFSP